MTGLHEVCYDKDMRKIITEYISNNGIRFHHSISTYETKRRSATDLPPETHYTCEVLLLLSGEIDYNIEGQLFHLEPMDAIFILPHKLHSMEVDRSQPYERMVLHFPPDLFSSFTELSLFSTPNHFSFPFILPKNIIEKSDLPSLMKQCEDICSQKDKYIQLRFIRTIFQIVETLDKAINSLNESNALQPIKVDKISYACIQYVHENLTNKEMLTPQRIAQELHISTSHLQHTFKKTVGVPLHYYVFKQKMQLAKKLLEQGNPPQVVSDTLGYEYYSTFYHNFIKHFQAPPTAFMQIDQNVWKMEEQK